MPKAGIAQFGSNDLVNLRCMFSSPVHRASASPRRRGCVGTMRGHAGGTSALCLGANGTLYSGDQSGWLKAWKPPAHWGEGAAASGEEAALDDVYRETDDEALLASDGDDDDEYYPGEYYGYDYYDDELYEELARATLRMLWLGKLYNSRPWPAAKPQKPRRN